MTILQGTQSSQFSTQTDSGSSWAPSASASAQSSQIESSQETTESVQQAQSTQGVASEAASATASPELIPEESEPDAEELPKPTFTIPAEVLAKAKAAKEGTAESYWTHKLYVGPDDAKIKVHYCKSKHTTENVLQRYFLDKPVLGFDIEWLIGATAYSPPKKNVSLIQIASEDRIILIHLGCFPKDSVDDLVAPTLKKMMEDASILKCGVAIKADCTRMRKYLEINTHGIFELSHLHKLVTYSATQEYGLINKRLCSLTDQAQTHLGLPIFKGEVRGSDWSEALSMDQILYAASDAYAGYAIFRELERKRLALKPRPPRPFPAEENKPIRLASGVEIAAPPTEDAKEDAPRKTSGEALAQDTADIELECEDAAETTGKGKPTAKATPKPEKAVDPIVEAAAQFALKYKTAHPKSTASPAQVRAYHIWYSHPELSIEDIAAKLRDPPLQTATVTSYILEALRLEGRGVIGSVAWLVDPLRKTEEGRDDAEIRGLRVEKERLRGLIESLKGDQRNAWRYKGLVKIVGGVGRMGEKK